MKLERARLKRLQRLERVRAIAKQAAAAEAAAAESTLSQLEALAERTRMLATDYATRSEARDGAALQYAGRFAGGLQQVYATTAGDAQRARVVANDKMTLLGQAERSRAAVEDRATAQARRIAQGGGEMPALGSRKGFGTPLE
jgi:hypothetical protein